MFFFKDCRSRSLLSNELRLDDGPVRGVSFREVAFLLQIVKTTLKRFRFISLELSRYHVHQLSFNCGVRYSNLFGIRQSGIRPLRYLSGIQAHPVLKKKIFKYQTSPVFVWCSSGLVLGEISPKYRTSPLLGEISPKYRTSSVLSGTAPQPPHLLAGPQLRLAAH